MNDELKKFRAMTQDQILSHFNPDEIYSEDEVLAARLVLEEKKQVERENAPLNGTREFRLLR